MKRGLLAVLMGLLLLSGVGDARAQGSGGLDGTKWKQLDINNKALFTWGYFTGIQIFATLRIAGHSQAEPLDGTFPAPDQLGKGALVILLLHAPHCLFVGNDKERPKRSKGSGPHTTIPVRARELSERLHVR